MNLRWIANRIVRLESKQPIEPRFAPLYEFLACGTLDALDDETLQALDELLEELEVERALAMEVSPLGIVYRRELDRLGWEQPPTLRDIDVLAEVVRMASVPTPTAESDLPNGMRELPQPESDPSEPDPHFVKEIL